MGVRDPRDAAVAGPRAEMGSGYAVLVLEDEHNVDNYRDRV